MRGSSTAGIVPAYIGICVIWGTTWLAIKVGLQFAPPITSVGARFALAGLALLAVAVLRGETRPLRALPWKLVAIMASCLFGLNYVLTYVAEQGLASGLTAILFGTMPFFTFFFRRLLLAERATGNVWIGTVLAFCGVGVISLVAGTRGALPYALAIVGAAVLAAFANVYAKRHSDVAPLTVLPPAMLLAGSVVGTVGIAWERPDIHAFLAPASLGAVLYLALVGSALAFFLNSWLLQRIDVSILNLVALIIPVIAVFVGVMFGSETVRPSELAGATLVLAGMWYALGRRAPANLVPVPAPCSSTPRKDCTQ
ncbi:MAG: DMT family transporter [Vulcanimicrobiaceae bacterium]